MIDEAITLGIIDASDWETIETARELRNKVIQVNAFEGLSEQEIQAKSHGDKVSLLHRLGVA